MTDSDPLRTAGPAGGGRRRATIPPEAAGERLDRALARALPALSRTRLKELIAAGAVVATEDGATVVDPASRVKPGQNFDILIPEPVPAEPVAQAIALDVVYEDAALLVVDKPAGMVVHPAPGSPEGTLVNALIAHCGDSLSGIGGVARPGIVHRLDKDTSGLMVVAKTDIAHRALAAGFADRSLSRTYRAVVKGRPMPPAGTVDAPIGRSPRDRKKMAVVARGKPAVTRYRTDRPLAGGRAALVTCTLETGRTHQIRVHMAHIGHAVVGDPLYGGRPRGDDAVAEAMRAFPRQALHAAELRFPHPETGETMHFTSDLPNEMMMLIAMLERFEYPVPE
ncbi:MAG: RluA family pseudouridine synthase [Azospirillaceae bacterium]